MPPKRTRPLPAFDLSTGGQYIKRYFGEGKTSIFGPQLGKRLDERTPYELRRDKYGSIDSDIDLDEDKRKKKHPIAPSIMKK